MSDTARLNGIYKALGTQDYQTALDKIGDSEKKISQANALIEEMRGVGKKVVNAGGWYFDRRAGLAGIALVEAVNNLETILSKTPSDTSERDERIRREAKAEAFKEAIENVSCWRVATPATNYHHGMNGALI